MQENLKDLIENVYTSKFIDDYLTAKFRNFESLIKSRINFKDYKVTNIDLEEIFDDSNSISFFYLFEMRHDFVQTYSLN